MSTQTLSGNLTQLMKMHGGLSISDLARQTRVPQPTLHHILTGITKKPRKESLEAIATFFSVTLEQLMGVNPLPQIIPSVIKENLKISTVPIIEWGDLENWISAKDNTLIQKEIIIDNKIDPNSFALVMKDSSMEPMFPENSILIFEANKKAKDRSYAIVYFIQQGAIMFNRLFIEGAEIYIKQEQKNGNAQLIKLKPNEAKVVASLTEVRLKF